MRDYIRVCDVEKYYGNGESVTKAIDRVSFTVNRGEFMGVWIWKIHTFECAVHHRPGDSRSHFL